MKRIIVLFSLLLGLACLGGCDSTQTFTGECQADTECPVGAFCNAGLCACRSDEACAAGEICNSQFVCQARSGCRRNGDCPTPDTQFCDIATGNCIDKVRVDGQSVSAGCGSNVHCDPGFVCEPSTKACVAGCYDDSDCPLYRLCNSAGGAGGIGQCQAGACRDASFCEFGELCVSGQCQGSGDPNHCAECNNQPGDCGDPDNFCLINPNYDANDPSQGGQYFCGVSCDPEATTDLCPNGYGCGRVQLLTSDLCQQNSDCCDASNPGECCADGERSCGGRRICAKGEGETNGACTCLTDSDCALDELPPTCAGSCGGLGLRLCNSDADCAALPCDLNNRTCQNPQGRPCNSAADCDSFPLCSDLGGGSTVCITTGLPCSSSIECLCNAGTCIGTGRACSSGADCNLSCQGGGCILGASCAPDEGLSCQDLR